MTTSVSFREAGVGMPGSVDVERAQLATSNGTLPTDGFGPALAISRMGRRQFSLQRPTAMYEPCSRILEGFASPVGEAPHSGRSD